MGRERWRDPVAGTRIFWLDLFCWAGGAWTWREAPGRHVAGFLVLLQTMRQGCLMMSHLAWLGRSSYEMALDFSNCGSGKDKVFNHAHEKGQKVSAAVAFVYAQLEHRSRKHTSQKKRVENTEN